MATSKQVKTVVFELFVLMTRGESEHRVKVIAQELEERGYTQEELQYMRKAMPFDQDIRDALRYNRPLLPADFDAVIQKRKKQQAVLSRKITAQKMEKVLEEHPDLERDHFRCVSYDSQNRKLYQYLPDGPPPPRTQNFAELP